MSDMGFVANFLGMFGTIFLLVGLGFLTTRIWTDQEFEQLQTLPLLSATQLCDTPAGVKALVEGKIAERNAIDEPGFAVYVRSL